MKKIYVIICIFVIILGAVLVYLKNRITFSIVIPVYNSEKYLSRCLDSVLAQKGSYEVIAVNDGSTDNSLNILQEYAAKYSNLIIMNQKNGGVSFARNVGLAVAKNKYITFIDSDDWVEYDMLSSAKDIIKKDHPDILLTGIYDVYDHQWVRDTLGEAAVREVRQENRFPSRKLDKLALFSPFYGNDAHSDLYYSGTGVRGQFFLKDFITKNRIIFPEEATCGEDDVFIYKAFLNNPLISIMVKPIYNYRNRADSIAKSANIMSENRKTLSILQSSDEFKKASRRIQMLLNDSWLSWTLLGFANIKRHHMPLQQGLLEAEKAYSSFMKYNKEEQKSCRNLQKLKKLLYSDDFNQLP